MVPRRIGEAVSLGVPREVLRLRPAPCKNRAKKKARDSAQDDGPASKPRRVVGAG